ncbi:MAG: response regulator transcription factor [Flavipsychrobacter sp.]|nr:response regulator transcription factor [Flavipsychrobacter sp.]
MSRITVAVLDDHQLIADAIAGIVNGQDDYTYWGGFVHSRDLDEKIATHGAPDVLLLDINLNGEDGIELCKQYTRKHAGMKIAMITGLTQPAVVKNAMRTGANGFMLKNIAKDDLLQGIRTMMRGEQYIHEEIQKLIVADALYRHRPSDYVPKLSRREKEVLELIMKECTTQEIADTLFISVNTVETHRASLLQKTGAKNIAGLVKVAIEKGLTN